jgi:hypothetical protein
MIPERHSLQPLITQLRCTKEKVFLIGRDRLNEKELKSPGREATLLSMKLIVANARIITPSFCRPPEECSRGINLLIQHLQQTLAPARRPRLQGSSRSSCRPALLHSLCLRCTP